MPWNFYTRADSRHFHARFFRLWFALAVTNCGLTWLYAGSSMRLFGRDTVAWLILNIALLIAVAAVNALVLTGFSLARDYRRAYCLNCRHDLRDSAEPRCTWCRAAIPEAQLTHIAAELPLLRMPVTAPGSPGSALERADPRGH